MADKFIYMDDSLKTLINVSCIAQVYQADNRIEVIYKSGQLPDNEDEATFEYETQEEEANSVHRKLMACLLG